MKERKPVIKWAPTLVGSKVMVCAGCGARGSVNRGLLKKGETRLLECAKCRKPA